MDKRRNRQRESSGKGPRFPMGERGVCCVAVRDTRQTRLGWTRRIRVQT